MRTVFFVLSIFISLTVIFAQSKYEKDFYKTSQGELVINFLGHGSLSFEFKGKTIYIDPCGQFANYDSLPKADLILITHQHPDHLDQAAIGKIAKVNTKYVVTKTVYETLQKGMILNNKEKKTIDGLEITAVPAYNTTAGREKFHPKGRDNGYIIKFGDKKVYVAGDTENIPEMSDLKNIDIAFLPMNQPYTMLPSQAADAALKFKPKVLYPYHYGETDVTELKKILSENKKIEVKIRKMN